MAAAPVMGTLAVDGAAAPVPVLSNEAAADVPAGAWEAGAAAGVFPFYYQEGIMQGLLATPLVDILIMEPVGWPLDEISAAG